MHRKTDGRPPAGCVVPAVCTPPVQCRSRVHDGRVVPVCGVSTVSLCALTVDGRQPRAQAAACTAKRGATASSRLVQASATRPCTRCQQAMPGCFNTPKAPLPSACESYAGAASACAGRRRSYA